MSDAQAATAARKGAQMLDRIVIFLAAASVAGPAHGAGLEAPPTTAAPACPVAAADAPPVLPSGAAGHQDDFRLVYACARPTPGA